MTKFNKPVNVVDKINNHPEATENHAGGLHFNTSAEMDLYLKSTVGFLDDKYYQKSEDVLKDLRQAITKVDRSFVLKLANYARNKMYLRSIPMVLLAEAAHAVFPGETPNASKSIVKDYAPKIIVRADEINEVLAYSINVIGKGHKAKLANALKKGVSQAFHKFDEYQFAKYNRKGAITFKDAMRLVHPTSKDPAKNELFKKIISDGLATPDTWEVKISGEGSTAENWNAIAPKMGLMALVRNLRNMEEKGAEEALKFAYAALRDPEKVLKSKMLPFRFFSATREVGRNATRDALNTAMDISLANLPKINGNLAVFSDTSGSMSTPVSEKSKVSCKDIATLFGAMSTNMVADGFDYLACAFATDVGEAQLSKRDSVFTNQSKIDRVNTNGCGTNAYKVFPFLRGKNMKPDVIVIFSDMQCYGGAYDGRGEQSLAVQWAKYKKEVNPKAILVSVHLNGYAGSQFPPNAKDVILLSGWSENVLSFIAAYQDRENVLDVIKNNY